MLLVMLRSADLWREASNLLKDGVIVDAHAIEPCVTIGLTIAV